MTKVPKYRFNFVIAMIEASFSKRLETIMSLHTSVFFAKTTTSNEFYPVITQWSPSYASARVAKGQKWIRKANNFWRAPWRKGREEFAGCLPALAGTSQTERHQSHTDYSSC